MGILHHKVPLKSLQVSSRLYIALYSLCFAFRAAVDTLILLEVNTYLRLIQMVLDSIVYFIVFIFILEARAASLKLMSQSPREHEGHLRFHKRLSFTVIIFYFVIKLPSFAIVILVSSESIISDGTRQVLNLCSMILMVLTLVLELFMEALFIVVLRDLVKIKAIITRTKLEGRFDSFGHDLNMTSKL